MSCASVRFWPSSCALRSSCSVAAWRGTSVCAGMRSLHRRIQSLKSRPSSDVPAIFPTAASQPEIGLFVIGFWATK